MFIKTLNNNTVDIFFNKGWDTWVRLKKNGTIISVVAGTHKPSAKVLDVLKNKIKWG